MDISTDDSTGDDNEEERGNKEVGTIASIGNVNIYPACIVAKCHRKKLDNNGRCGSCGTRVATACAASGFRRQLHRLR